MEVREDGAFVHHADHPLLGHQGVDALSGREGELRAVVVETDGALTAYIRGRDAREFEVPLSRVQALR